MEFVHQDNILVTGINGFVGEHLAKQIKSLGHSVLGIGREPVAAEHVLDHVDMYVQCDLMDSTAIQSLDLSQTSGIIHLAGLASVAESFNKPNLYKEGNARITRNVLELAHKQAMKGRVVVISTGALYDANQPMPLTEDSGISENSPYATGKIKAEEVAKEYRSKGLDVVIARPFNHVGPHQGPGFLVPDLYNQLIQASAYEKNEILVGNLNTRRDYTDVRDIADAYVKLMQAEVLHHDTYNICTGTSMSGLEVLDILKVSMDLTDIRVTLDQSRIRPTDAPDVVGNPARIHDDTGWKPKSNARRAIEDFVIEQKK